MDQKELRLFISSTFTDLADEREYLVKHIFPEIKAAARERGVEFTEIDLRWGITVQEVQEGKTIKTCLDEVDRCRPYFIGILGSRYGWQPTQDDITKDPELLGEFPWVEDAVASGMSVTEMEMTYGALGEQTKRSNAFFYFRKPDDTSEESIFRLRERILASGYPVLEDYSDIQELGAQVRTDMLRLIEEQFPATAEPTPLELERTANDAYAHTRRRAYVPNPAYIERLTAFANDSDPERKPLVIVGKSGSGKSSLIAYWSEDYRKAHPDEFVITHYVGAAHSSPASVIRHIMLEIKERSGTADAIPEQADELERDLPQWLAKLPDEKIVIALDAVNQLEDPRGHGLNWLPSFLPPNIHLILSTTDDVYGKPGEEHTLARRGWTEFIIEPLTAEQRHEVTKYYLSQYHKTLTRPQLEALATSDKCASPLFLRTVLEELRIFGKYRQIDERIAHYLDSADTDDLFQRVLERMEQDYGEPILRQVLSLIGASRHGLSENELLGLLAHANRYELSRLLHALDYHLIRNAGLLNFFHMYLRRAVEKRYNHGEHECRNSHRQLAEYFHAQPADKRRADEEPYNWQRAGDMSGFERCLSDVPLLFILLDEERRHELIVYWKDLREHTDIKDLYYRVADEYIKERTDPDEQVKLYKMLGDALTAASEYEIAEDFIRKALALTINKYGEDSLEVANAKTDLGAVLYFIGAFDEVELLIKDALVIKKKTVGESNLSYAKTLNILGPVYYWKAKYNEAEEAYTEELKIYEKFNKSSREAADVLNSLGTVYFSQGKYTQARDSFNDAVEMLHKLYGNQHYSLIPCIRNLAMAEERCGNNSGSDIYHKEEIALCEAIFGKRSKENSHALGNAASFYSRLGDYSKAFQMHSTAQEIRKELLGEDHYQTINGYTSIGITYLRLNQYGKGTELLTTYLPKLIDTLGKDNSVIAIIENLWQDAHPESFLQYKHALASSENAQGHE